MTRQAMLNKINNVIDTLMANRHWHHVTFENYGKTGVEYTCTITTSCYWKVMKDVAQATEVWPEVQIGAEIQYIFHIPNEEAA